MSPIIEVLDDEGYTLALTLTVVSPILIPSSVVTRALTTKVLEPPPSSMVSTPLESIEV